MESAESEVRAVLDTRSAAIRAMDLDRLMSVFSPDIVYFDVVPPLKYAGSDVLRDRFVHWFDRWTSSIGQEVREVSVVASGNVAVAHMLIRASGTLKIGRDVDYWVRTTNSLRRSDDSWLITHEHVSLPVDVESGRAVMDLVP